MSIDSHIKRSEAYRSTLQHAKNNFCSIITNRPFRINKKRQSSKWHYRSYTLARSKYKNFTFKTVDWITLYLLNVLKQWALGHLVNVFVNSIHELLNLQFDDDPKQVWGTINRYFFSQGFCQRADERKSLKEKYENMNEIYFKRLLPECDCNVDANSVSHEIGLTLWSVVLSFKLVVPWFPKEVA